MIELIRATALVTAIIKAVVVQVVQLFDELDKWVWERER
jgi:hypothetical protein